MPTTSLAYRGAIRFASAVLPLVAWVDPKLSRAHNGRAGVLERVRAWAAAKRDPKRPLVWFHAPSVGEGLQAEAVMQALKKARPDWQLAYTHFSSSAEGLAKRVPADISDYLPYDTAGAAEVMLDALRPNVLVFTKLDLWPELATRAAVRGVKVILVAGTVRPGSGRLGWPARRLLEPGYAALSAAAAIDPTDGVRLAALGTKPAAVTVLGDPRFDSVAAKVAAVAKDDPLLSLGGGAPTLVAGSTWSSDEEIILQAYVDVRRDHPDARLIIVPHEPTESHLKVVEEWAHHLGLPAPVRLSAAIHGAPIVLVDRIGVLAALYGAGTFAYVGGGYRRAGLHSVLEPAAWGLPVVFGPNWTESRDAVLLQQAGAAVGLPAQVHGAAALREVWREWIANAGSRTRAGVKARAVVDAGLGASARCAELIRGAVEG